MVASLVMIRQPIQLLSLIKVTGDGVINRVDYLKINKKIEDWFSSKEKVVLLPVFNNLFLYMPIEGINSEEQYMYTFK
jgi:hypothetical protein